jgi:hypothetical protein
MSNAYLLVHLVHLQILGILELGGQLTLGVLVLKVLLVGLGIRHEGLQVGANRTRCLPSLSQQQETGTRGYFVIIK